MSSSKSYITCLRAAFALILPVVVISLWHSGYLSVIAQIALEQSHTRWLGFALVGCLIILEWRLLVTLSRLARAGGRMEVFSARESDPHEIARRHRFRFRLVAVALSALLTPILVEVVFRTFEIKPPPPARFPLLDCEEVDNSLNALGIREKWDSLPEGDRRLRIACLGDSMVYGFSVEPHESFCHLIETMLTTGWPEGVVTINMGYPGTSPRWQLRKYLALRETLRPDVVVHVVYPNDLGIYMHERLSDIYRIRDEDLWVGNRSYLLRYAERQIRYWLAWNKTIDYFRGGASSRERAEAWVRFKADVAACKAKVEEGGAVYALVLFPWLVRLDDYLLMDVHTEIGAFASQLGVPYLDLLELFAGRDAEALRISLANEHPNPTGHRLAAERIARFLQEEILPALTR
ncbi:MAG: SGNH/GDSL hydrolase family protein [Phycisphaerae bacterium]